MCDLQEVALSDKCKDVQQNTSKETKKTQGDIREKWAANSKGEILFQMVKKNKNHIFVNQIVLIKMFNVLKLFILISLNSFKTCRFGNRLHIMF